MKKEEVMLPFVTHPLACLIYFIAIHVALDRLFGEVKTATGFIGRGMLFGTAGLAVSVAAVLVGDYAIGVSAAQPATRAYPIALLAVTFMAVAVLVTLGMFLASAIKRPYLAFKGMSAGVATMLYLLLSRLYAY